MAPANYYKQVSLVVKGALSPLTLHLLGSVHTEKSRPAKLDQHHIDIFRNMQLSGVREHETPAVENGEDLPEDEEPELEELEPRIPEVPVRPLSATATFLEMMLPSDSKLRDITISPGILDFGQSAALSMSEKHTVTITNRTSQKVTVMWMISGETRMPCSKADKQALFSVYPTQCDIKPKGMQDFQVAFKPQHHNSVEGEILEALVYHKVNRTFRLVDLERFTPPWMLSVRSLGHTMGNTRNDPIIDIAESNIRFRPCAPGERTYQVAMLTNPGDMCLAFQIMPAVEASSGDVGIASLKDLKKQQAPFKAFPTHGLILPHQFQLVALEFAPTSAKNLEAYVANFQVVVDYNETQPKTIRVSGRAWQPQLSFCRGAPTVTFPPTCSGIASNMICDIKNVSEIPIWYECRIPTRFRSTFSFPEASGQLAPSESGSITAQFCPTSEKVFSAPMYCAARCVEDPDNFVEGPLRALVSGGTSGESPPDYVMQLVGHGKGPALSLEPEGLDLGAVKACEEVQNQVVILNSSSLAVHYEVSAAFVGTDAQAAAVAEEALRLGTAFGTVEGRCTEKLQIDFRPPVRGEFIYQITVAPKGGRAIHFQFHALVQYPSIQIADLRTECDTLQPQSMMWTQFQVDGINELYRDEVTDVERRFQAAIGIDEKKLLVRQLKPFQLLFGTAAAGSTATVVYLVLSNPSRLGIRFSFQTPKNLNLENSPYWCDEKALIDDREAHFSWVEEHGIYDIQPRSGEIPPGDFLHVKMTYHHHSIGTHILPVVFNVHDGRSVLFYLKAHSVAPSVGCLSVRSSVVALQPVPLGVGHGVVQPVELTNSGAVAAPWRVDLSSIFDHNMENHDFEVLSVTPTEGILEAQSSTFLHFKFTPLEAKRYVCPVRIEMLSADGRPAEELLFELHADGYQKKEEFPKVEPAFPSNLPLQTYAPVPGAGAALSIEVLDFGKCPLRARNSQMLVLVNYTSEFVLSFRWDARQLFRSANELEIEPQMGELSPGSHCVIVFRVCSDDALDVSGEVACHIAWTHLSDYGQRSLADLQEDTAAKPEVFAAHRDHIHEPQRPKVGANSAHISVANRLTVSRFRHLMSSAAGQKFLNENLHRTSVLSSHIPVMSPRRAMQASTQGLAAQQKEELPGGQTNKNISLAEASTMGPAPPTPPTTFPIYVRLRVVVADWEVPAERQADFVVQSPARALAAQQEDENAGLEDDVDPNSTSMGYAVGGSPVPRKPRQTHALPVPPSGAPFAAAAKASEAPNELGHELIAGVLDHVIQEVLNEEGFGSILDNMMLQETPNFLQLEDSVPPRLPEAKPLDAPEPEEASGAVPKDDADDEAEDDTDVADDLVQLVRANMSRSRTGPQTLDLLGDFEAPSSTVQQVSQPVVEKSSRPATTDASRSRFASSTSEYDDLVAGSAAELHHEDDGREKTWQEALAEYGEVDLEAFRDSAGEVLDRVLLDMMDDVIAGRLNWMRPLPRVRRPHRR
eukprot:TRINITY_DN24181_c0_g1_i1.p1 TRINITY_DN24181_c0_g1~~TRINITY_DN24181_c0_g1_i1.p1  ORF type:complete len:1639 (+),score=361.06 TRINITY_DN24181_c0_g1_i1:466-4917(+)